jgi:hypothetical protein
MSDTVYPDEPEEDDGGDGYFGNADFDDCLGMPMPQMNVNELAYFNAARNERERLDRLKEIAKRRHNEILTEKMRRVQATGERYSTNSAEDYMNNLQRSSTESQVAILESMGYSPPPGVVQKVETAKPVLKPLTLSAEEGRALKRKGLNAGGLYIDNLTAPQPDPGVEKKVEEGLASTFRDMERRVSAGSDSDPIDPELSVVDKQIAFLEQHLAKLQNEAAAGPSPEEVRATVKTVEEKIGTGGSAARLSPVGDGMGDMTEEDTLEAFNRIRAKQAEAREAPPMDPLAIPLPNRSDGRVADVGTAAWSNDDDSDEDFARLALIAMRIEQARFIEAQRKVLDEHEANLENIYSKYAPELK